MEGIIETIINTTRSRSEATIVVFLILMILLSIKGLKYTTHIKAAIIYIILFVLLLMRGIDVVWYYVILLAPIFVMEEAMTNDIIINIFLISFRV